MPTGIYIRTKKIGGWKLSTEQKRNIGLGLKGKKSYAWKGQAVSYRGLHQWVAKEMGKANHCDNNSNHKSTRYHWANISGQYYRNLNDFRQLCPKCNMKESYDRKVNYVK